MKSANQIIQDIAEVLGQCDGRFIEQIANQILTTKVKYIGDSMFETDDELSDEAAQKIINDIATMDGHIHPEDY